jgi:hypothetical protein
MTDQIRPIHVHPRTAEVMKEINMAEEEWDDRRDYVREIGDLQQPQVFAYDETHGQVDITAHVRYMHGKLTEKPNLVYLAETPAQQKARLEDERRPGTSANFEVFINDLVQMMRERFDVMQRRERALDVRAQELEEYDTTLQVKSLRRHRSGLHHAWSAGWQANETWREQISEFIKKNRDDFPERPVNPYQKEQDHAAGPE